MVSINSKEFKEAAAAGCDALERLAREKEREISKAVWVAIEKTCGKSKNQILGSTTVQCPGVPETLQEASYLLAAGKTFEAKDRLKALGGKWMPDLGGWVYPLLDCEELQGKNVDIENVTISPRTALVFIDDNGVKTSIRRSINPEFHARLGKFMEGGKPTIDANRIAARNRGKLVEIAGEDVADAGLVNDIAGDPAKRLAFWNRVDDSTVPGIYAADPRKAEEFLRDGSPVIDCALIPTRLEPENRKCTIISSIVIKNEIVP